jgi:iron complex transport system substrate-binding protein
MRRLLAIACVLSTVVFGCERATPPGGGNHAAATSAGATSTTSSHPAQQLSLDLHDWEVDPRVAPEECDRPAPRIVSAAPNVTEICCALGLRDALVGRTRYCTYPPGIEAVPSIGALNDLNVESLLALRPELIIISGARRAIRDRLSHLDLRFEAVPDDTLADLFAAIRDVGKWTNRPLTAERLVAGVQADLDRMAQAFADTPKRRVLILAAPMPSPPTQVYAAGPESYYHDLLARVGHIDVVPPGRPPVTPVSLEFILQADPDVIVELAPDTRERPNGGASALPAWRAVGPLKAVQSGRIHVLVGPEHFLLGPRVAQTFAALCATIAEPGHE